MDLHNAWTSRADMQCSGVRCVALRKPTVHGAGTGLVSGWTRALLDLRHCRFYMMWQSAWVGPPGATTEPEAGFTRALKARAI